MKNYKVLFYYCEFSSRHLEECLCSDNPGDNGETMRLPRFARNDVVGTPHSHLSLRGTKCRGNPVDGCETMRLPRFARNDVVGNPHTHLSLRGTKCRGNLQQKIGKSRVTMSHTYSGQIE